MNYTKLCGWKPDYDLIHAYNDNLGVYGSFKSGAPSLVGSGAGKVTLLYKAYQDIVDSLLKSHFQTIGDCVSHGWGLGIDILACVEIKAGERERWVAKIATEIIYAASRVEIGGGRLGNGDGSMGSWMAEAVGKYGTLNRLKYLDGKYDFTTYDGDYAKSIGARGRGVPNELEPSMREHPVKNRVLVKSYEEARDSIANGYPVPVCSNVGFHMERDAKGFAKPNPRDPWGHCMLFCGEDDEDGRPGLLCWNSWGDKWIKGGKRHGQPDGSFWVDAEVADRMLSQEDSYAISGYEGFKAQKIDYSLF